MASEKMEIIILIKALPGVYIHGVEEVSDYANFIIPFL